MAQQVNDSVLKKVTLFITRGKPGARSLLVLDHAGEMHIPAGTVREDESPVHAALRQGREETGLPDLTLLAELGSRRLTLAGDERVLIADALLQLTPDSSSTVVRGTVLRRGMTIRLVETAGDYSRVLHETTRTDAAGDAVVTARSSGWLLTAQIAATMERHFVHLTTTIPTTDQWTVQSGPESLITVRWVPLRVDIRLAGQQQEWLDNYFKTVKG